MAAKVAATLACRQIAARRKVATKVAATAACRRVAAVSACRKVAATSVQKTVSHPSLASICTSVSGTQVRQTR